MKKIIKKNLPKILLSLIQNIVLLLRLFNYKKPIFFCKVCNQNTKGYLTGFFPKLTIACQNCFSEGKHRIIASYLNNYKFNNKKILHFAPEDCLVKFIEKQTKNTEYIKADIIQNNDIVKVDIEKIEFQNNYFDLIICSHVLEHVNDKVAISNIKRVLKKNGEALLMFPIIESWEKTYRNDRIIKPQERELHFEQYDHLHLFGKDIEKTLTEENFLLKKIIPFGEETVKYGYDKGETLFIIKKL